MSEPRVLVVYEVNSGEFKPVTLPELAALLAPYLEAVRDETLWAKTLRGFLDTYRGHPKALEEAAIEYLRGRGWPPSEARRAAAWAVRIPIEAKEPAR